jgi:hypothetical protein
MMKLIKEPFIHFVLLGAALFGLYGLVNESESELADNQIVVSAGRIDQMTRIFDKTWRRDPSDAELKGLIDDYVLEEVYYRQAKLMGIDQDDVMIRRRLRQKLEFLSDDVAAMVQPTDDDLKVYLDANAQKFRQEASYSFQQIYYNPELHGEDIKQKAAAQLASLRKGEEVLGDRTMLPQSFELVSSRVIDSTFGVGFTQSLSQVSVGQWQGPVVSSFGVHLVKIDQRVDGRVPDVQKIKPALEREWANDKRMTVRKELNERMLKDYEVVIEWPKS